VQPFTEYLEPQRRPWKLGAVLFALCGALALSIAVVGLYGVIAYLVVHRRHEIGVRMALGAERGDVVRMVLRQALMLAGIGVLIGVGVALVAAPYLEPLLFETPARDGIVLGATAAILAAAAIVAGTVPAWRASHVTPTEALREG
jgi:ABC-type antimicrobial peptide transport system permease subunit